MKLAPGPLLLALALSACQAGAPPKGPPADCAAVGALVASLELGNYAPVEARAPAVAKAVAACRAARIDQAEATCLLGTHDRFAAAQCAPALFPDIDLKGTGCAPAVAKLGDVLARELGRASMPTAPKMSEALRAALAESCAVDQWPAALKACIVAADSSTAAMSKCSDALPPDQQKKIGDRLAKAMQTAMR